MKKNLMFLLIVSLMILIMINGCVEKETYIEAQAQLEMVEVVQKEGKILFVIAQKEFRDDELSKPKKILEDAGYRVDVASITTDFAQGMLGTRVKPDLAVKDANADNYEYVVVVGGSGSLTLVNYPEVLELLKNAKRTAAICFGPVVLAEAGVLDGKSATVAKTPESVRVLEEGGAIFVDKSLVVDGTLITANGPGASEDFGKSILDVLERGGGE